ncbi:MAG: hypothetical protein DBX47_07010 [Clostridiales bacterium]|nr:MAG: hypothetical protein DBX47_07010 [Clostridiales bacterium]
MKKRIISLTLAMAMIVSMFTVFALSSSAAVDLSGCTLASADGSTEKATAYKTENLGAGVDLVKKGPEAAYEGTHNSYFGYFYNYLYDGKIWEEHYTLPAVAAYKERIDMVWEMLYGTGKDNLYSAKYYDPYHGDTELPSLETLWGAARSSEGLYVRNSLSNMRNEMLNNGFTDETYGTVAGITEWLTYYGANADAATSTHPNYSDVTWRAIVNDVNIIDGMKNSCTEDEGFAAIQTLKRHMSQMAAPGTNPSDDAVLVAGDAGYDAAKTGYDQLIDTTYGAKYNQAEGGPAVGNTTSSTYFALFYNYYYGKITLPKYQAYPEVAAFKTLLDKVYVWMYGSTQGSATLTGTVRYGMTGIADKLQNAWNAARANVPVDAGWNNLRAKITTEQCEGLLGTNPDGVKADGTACKKYTTASWNAFFAAVCWGDSYRKTCTDAQGEAALNDIVTKYKALVLNPEYVSAPDADNIAAYNFCKQNAGGKELYVWYYERANNLFTNPELWTNTTVVQAFIDKAKAAGPLFNAPYNNNSDYKSYVVFNNGTPSDMTLEAMWTAARSEAYIGPVLQTMRDELFDTVLSEDHYTADSWAAWISIKQDLSNAVDNAKNSTTSTDQDGYTAIQDIKDAIALLELDPFYPIKGLDKATTPEDIAAATAAKAKLNETANNKYGNYLGNFLLYGDRITLDSSKQIAEVTVFLNSLEICKLLLKTDELYMPYYYGVDWNNVYGKGNLETWWNTARLTIPVSNGLSNMRNAYLDANVTDWLDSYSRGYSYKYTDETFAAIIRLVNAIDAAKNTVTDAQGAQLLEDLKTAVAALALREPAIEDPTNYEAYRALSAIVKTYYPLLSKFTLAESFATNEYIAFKAKMDEIKTLSEAAYDGQKDYKGFSDSAVEQLWFAARNACHIGPVLITERDAILNAIKAESEYTPITWDAWVAVKTELIDAIDSVKNSGTATDADGVAAIKDLKDAADSLILKINKPAAAKPSAPVISRREGTTITITAVTGAEYGIRKDGEETVAWQTSNVFEGLESGVKYYFTVRILEDENYKQSESSAETLGQLGKKGDFDGDEAITLADAMAGFQILAGKTELTNAALDAFDLDGDNKIELTEIMKVFMVVAGKLTENDIQ